MEEEKLKRRIILEIQRSLWDRVTPQIRAVSFTLTDEEVVVYVYTDGEIPEEEKEDLDVIGAEVVAGMIDFRFIDVRIIRVDFPQKIPVQGELVFLRKEPAIFS
jgi:hypothetical protein